jgi:hypothetical protein
MVGMFQGETATIQQGSAGVIVSDTVQMKDSSAGVLVAGQIQGGNIRTGLLLAGKVEGQVETLLDGPRAMLAGLTAGAAFGLVLFLMRLLKIRKN